MDKNEERFRAATARFSDLAEARGWGVLSPYMGAKKHVDLLCPAGHRTSITPTNFQSGKGCRYCAGNDSAETRFKETIETRGGRVVGVYANSQAPVQVICPEGHEADPRPANVLSGQGMCRLCRLASGRQDVFYVVTGGNRVKLGISSGDPRTRLGDHRRAGYGQVARLWVGLPGGLALDTERWVRRSLSYAGIGPFKGHEYFLGRALPAILTLSDLKLDSMIGLHQ